MVSTATALSTQPPIPTSGPFTVDNVIGSSLIGGIGQGVLQGILLSQTAIFFEESTDGWLLKSTVAFINLVALFQTSIMGYHWWDLLVNHFGDYVASLTFEWSSEIQASLTSFMSTPVHIYFIHRAWKLTNRNRYLAIICGVLVAVIIVSSGITTAYIFLIGEAQTRFQPPSARVHSLDKALIVWSVCSAALDVTLTVTLLCYLIRSRQAITSRYFHNLIDSLITLVWQSATPPCICAIAICLIYSISDSMHQNSYWTTAPTDMLGKLYCSSLLITLNSRGTLNQQLHATGNQYPNGLMVELNTVSTGIHMEYDLPVFTFEERMKQDDCSGSSDGDGGDGGDRGRSRSMWDSVGLRMSEDGMMKRMSASSRRSGQGRGLGGRGRKYHHDLLAGASTSRDALLLASSSPEPDPDDKKDNNVNLSERPGHRVSWVQLPLGEPSLGDRSSLSGRSRDPSPTTSQMGLLDV